jgi:hypothetical protein
MHFKAQISLFLITLVTGFSAVTRAESTLAEAPFGYASGYTDNVDDEFDSEPQEMVLMEKPEILMRPNLHDRIFTSELSAEFSARYREQFGRTEEEENYFLTSRQGYYLTPTGLAATQIDAQRRAFAEYMLKRLAEYHTENIMKSDPILRHVYEIKQAVSNYNIPVGPSARLDLRYSFIGNYFNASYLSPKFNTNLSISMDPSSLTPTAPTEIYWNLTKEFTTLLSGETGYAFYDRAVRFLLSRRLSPSVTTNISESIHIASGANIDSSREALTLVGLNVIF